MQTEILLEGMEFHAFHGVYPEEKMLGNRFRVDVLMKLDVPFQPENQDLSRTIDYSLVYAILKDKMENATPLLESLGQGICRELAASFPLLNEMEICIAKANPAIGGLCEWVKVRSIWKKD
jgi:dihydroneopterin aldolase